MVLEVAHPHARGELRRVAAEPGVRVVLRGARLPRHGASVRQRRRRAGPTFDHALERVADYRRVVRGQRAPALVPPDRDAVPVRALDGHERGWGTVHPASGERRVRARHLERVHLDGAERHRAVVAELGSDAEIVGRVDHLVRPHLGHELRIDGVHRVLRGVQQRERSALLVGGVRGPPGLPVGVALPIRDRDLLRAVPVRAWIDAVLQRGGEREGLERRAGSPSGAALTGRDVHLGDVEVSPSHHREHLAGARIDGDEGRLRVLLARQVGGDGLLGGGLKVGVQGGRDLQPSPEHLRLGDPVVHEQDALRVVHEVRRFVGDGARLLRVRADLLALQLVRRLLRDVALLRHAVQHVVAPDLRVLRIVGGIEELGRRDRPRERRRLQHRQVSRRLVPVGPRGGLHAVGAVSEVDRVEVGGEDPVLAHLLLQLDGEQHLAHLLPDRPLRLDVDALPVLRRLVRPRIHLLHQLLRDRRAALNRASTDVVEGGPSDPDGIEPRVRIEVLVLGRDHRVAQMLGHRRERHVRSVHGGMKGRDELPVAVVEVRRLQRRRRLGEVELRVHIEERPEHHGDAGHGQRDEHPPEPANEAALPSRLPFPGGCVSSSPWGRRTGWGVDRHRSSILSIAAAAARLRAVEFPWRTRLRRGDGPQPTERAVNASER